MCSRCSFFAATCTVSQLSLCYWIQLCCFSFLLESSLVKIETLCRDLSFSHDVLLPRAMSLRCELKMLCSPGFFKFFSDFCSSLWFFSKAWWILLHSFFPSSSLLSVCYWSCFFFDDTCTVSQWSALLGSHVVFQFLLAWKFFDEERTILQWYWFSLLRSSYLCVIDYGTLRNCDIQALCSSWFYKYFPVFSVLCVSVLTLWAYFCILCFHSSFSLILMCYWSYFFADTGLVSQWSVFYWIALCCFSFFFLESSLVNIG